MAYGKQYALVSFVHKWDELYWNMAQVLIKEKFKKRLYLLQQAQPFRYSL